MLGVQAAGERQRADDPVADPLGVRRGGGQVPPGGAGFTTVERDHGADTVIAAGYARVLAAVREGSHLGQGLVPAARCGSSSSPRQQWAWARRTMMPARSASRWACRAAASAPSY